MAAIYPARKLRRQAPGQRSWPWRVWSGGSSHHLPPWPVELLAELEAAAAAGRPLRIRVVGLVRIADDVTPDLARAGVETLTVLGALQAPAAVKAALADRTRLN